MSEDINFRVPKPAHPIKIEVVASDPETALRMIYYVKDALMRCIGRERAEQKGRLDEHLEREASMLPIAEILDEIKITGLPDVTKMVKARIRNCSVMSVDPPAAKISEKISYTFREAPCDYMVGSEAAAQFSDGGEIRFDGMPLQEIEVRHISGIDSEGRYRGKVQVGPALPVGWGREAVKGDLLSYPPPPGEAMACKSLAAAKKEIAVITHGGKEAVRIEEPAGGGVIEIEYDRNLYRIDRIPERCDESSEAFRLVPKETK